MADTIFGKIIRGEIPCDKVYEDDDVLAFRDINPGAPTHVLVVPKRPIANVAAATADDAELLGRVLLAGARVAELEGVAGSGYRLVLNVGSDAGESVPHLHLHVLGGRGLSWPPG
jgi:histidine triad (HIT) family protein